MISVGIDVSKGKSMACFLDSDGEILYKPFLFEHTFSGIQRLTDRIQEQEKNGPVKIIMEATGIYHLPVAIHLHEQGFDVSVVNPLSTSRYRNIDVRNVKTDKADSVSIANYGRSYWHTLPAFKMHTDEYFWLNDAADDYLTISKSQNRLDLLFKNKLERSMPGIDKELASLNKETGKISCWTLSCNILILLLLQQCLKLNLLRTSVFGQEKRDTGLQKVKQPRFTLWP